MLDAGSVPSIDVTAVRMLVADNLERRGIRLLIAHDVGEARDVVDRAEGDEAARRVYPTVQDAVDSVRHSTHADR